MLFLAIPLLKSKWNGALVRELARHTAILVGVILVVVLLRISLGEERVIEVTESISSLAKIAVKSGAAVLIGPAVSFALFVYGPIRTLGHWNLQLTVVFVAFLVVFSWMLRGLKFDPLKKKGDHRAVLEFSTCNGTLSPAGYSAISKLFVTAVVMFCLGYIVSFTHFPPTARYGRETSVHLAAAFGGSLFRLHLFRSSFRRKCVSIEAFRHDASGLVFFSPGSLPVLDPIGFQTGLAKSASILDQCNNTLGGHDR